MEITRFLGLKNTVAQDKLRPGELSAAYDVDIDDAGSVMSRRGLTSVSATAAHSLWAKGDLCLVANGTTLKSVSTSGTLTTVGTLLSADPISYAESNGVVYLTNGVDTGRVVNGQLRRWGIQTPSRQPAATLTVGSMPVGTYQYAVTFMRADGEESGARTPATFEMTARGGITFSMFPSTSDSEVTHFALYLSGPNGVELYRAGVYPIATTTVNHRNEVTRLGVALDPEYAEPAPAGTAVEILAGVAYVADGSVVWYSDQYRLERFRRGTRFLQFPGVVNLLAAVDDGLYVATESATWFLSGTDPTSFKANRVLDVGAIPGTVAKIDSAEADKSDDDRTPTTRPAAFWMSPDGVVLARAGGAVQKVTMDVYGLPNGVRGASLARADRGYVAYMTSVQGSASSGNQH